MKKTNKFSNIGFILATAGSAVGLGNVIRFPFIMGESGGGVFFAIYLLTILFIGASIMLTEMVIGYKGEAGAATSFEKLATGSNRLWKNIGWGISGSSNVIFSYYTILLAWIIGYIWLSATGALPHNSADAEMVFSGVRGNMPSTFLLAGIVLITTFAIVARGITNGIEKLNLVLMPAILLIFTGMLFYAFSLEGFSKAVVFMFHMDFSAINTHVIISAVGMSFFTLSLGSAIVLAYSASLPKGTNLVRSIGYVVLLDTSIAIVSGLMIFSFVFTYGGNPSAGFGLVFITLGTVFANLGIFGQILGVTFFSALLFAGVTSAVSMIEPMLKSIHIRFGITRHKAALYLAVPTAILSSVVILSLGGYFGDLNLMDKLDYMLSNVLLPLGGLATTVFVGWFMDKSVVAEAVNNKLGYFFGLWYSIVKYIAPVVLIIVLLSLIGLI